MKGFAIACCGDCRLNSIVCILDQNLSYRKRDLGTPFDFIINQSELLVWHSKLTGFPEGSRPISDVLVLLHTDCLAIETNAFFATLRQKRHERYDPTLAGDFEFCEKQLTKIKVQTDRLSSVIRWHFGIIHTQMATELSMSSNIHEALECIRWPLGVPAFFQEPEKIIALHGNVHHRHHQGSHIHLSHDCPHDSPLHRVAAVS